MTSPGLAYLEKARALNDRVAEQMPVVTQVADRFTRTILAGRMVHVFGSGHSRVMVEEMWPRYGSFPGFHPMVELSLTFYQMTVGSNGIRQSMFLENVPGFAERILRNYDLDPIDSALVVSTSGCNVAPVEIAEGFQRAGIYVAGLVSAEHCAGSTSKRSDGKKLPDFSDAVLDSGAPLGDAMIQIEGMEMPVAPGSTVGGCLVVNALKAEIAQRLTDAGHPPRALASGAVLGNGRANEVFEAAYDEHGRRLARLYADLNREPGDVV
ncbi:MAG: sugar isomerase domain-containing protein [Planctomycetota bacterium]